jgi:hypothetical protein
MAASKEQVRALLNEVDDKTSFILLWYDGEGHGWHIAGDMSDTIALGILEKIKHHLLMMPYFECEHKEEPE